MSTGALPLHVEVPSKEMLASHYAPSHSTSPLHQPQTMRAVGRVSNNLLMERAMLGSLNCCVASVVISFSRQVPNENSVEPLTPTASAVTLDPTVLPASAFVMPVANEDDPLAHPDILAPWPLLRVIQKNEMNAIVTTRPLLAGMRIALFYGQVQTTPTMYTLQVDQDVHVTCLEGPAYTNHSCDPSAFFDMSSVTPTSPFPVLTALRDLAEGAEITFNYNCGEWDMAVPFHCLCNTDKCLGKIGGFSKLDIAVKRELSQFLSPFLAAKWRDEEAKATGSA